MARFVQPRCKMIDTDLPRREALKRLTALLAGVALPGPLIGCDDDPEMAPGEPPEPLGRDRSLTPEDDERLIAWVATLRAEGFSSPSTPLGLAAVRVGELAIGTPYEGFTLEEYIRAGGSPVRSEPLTLHLTRFDCVSLVESCIAIARIARSAESATWDAFAAEMERMRYRGGKREGYSSRLHYFSEWLADNEKRGLVRQMSRELGGVADERPLRFMSDNPDAYPAMAYPEIREEIAEMGRRLDADPRYVVPTAQIPAVLDRLQSGDILAFATAIPGLDVTHAAFAYRDSSGVMRVLHAPLSGGVVEITGTTIPEYVAAIRQSTGILVARPLDG